MTSRKKILLSAVYIVLAITVITSGAYAGMSKSGFVAPVQTVAAKRSDMKETLNFNGTIYSMTGFNVSSKAIGQVKRVYFDEGDEVKAGDIILKIDDEKVALRLKQAEEGVKAAEKLYEKSKIAIKLEREQIYLQITLAKSNLEAAEALYTKAKAGARPQEKKQAEAAMLSAEAAMKNSEANFARMKKLYDKRTISKQQYDLSKMEFDVAKAQHSIAKESYDLVQAGLRAEDIKAAEANYLSATTALNIAKSLKLKLELLESDIAAAKAGLKQAEYARKIVSIMLDDTLVRAPKGGVISKKFIEEGEIIQAPGVSLYKILDQSSMKVKVSIPESSLSKVRKGLNTRIDTVSYPDNPFFGEITRLSPTINIRLRTLEVEITVPNDDALLREGMFAKVSIYTALRSDALSVPVSALKKKNSGRYLFIVVDGVAVKKSVKTGITEGNSIEILSGVLAGDEVIYQGNLQLEDGMRVKVEN